MELLPGLWKHIKIPMPAVKPPKADPHPIGVITEILGDGFAKIRLNEHGIELFLSNRNEVNNGR